jgi:hypothetical protein
MYKSNFKILKEKFFRTQIFRIIFFITIINFSLPKISIAQSEVEYKLKAAYLLNFLEFIEFPANAFKTPVSPVVITILGKDPFGKIIDEIVSGEKIRNHPIVVKRIQTLNNLDNCHVLFISSSEKDNIYSILRKTKDSPVLTISDVEGFGKLGLGINFYLESSKIRFEINLTPLLESDIKVSSKLLRLAKVIN